MGGGTSAAGVSWPSLRGAGAPQLPPYAEGAPHPLRLPSEGPTQGACRAHTEAHMCQLCDYVRLCAIRQWCERACLNQGKQTKPADLAHQRQLQILLC